MSTKNNVFFDKHTSYILHYKLKCIFTISLLFIILSMSQASANIPCSDKLALRWKDITSLQYILIFSVKLNNAKLSEKCNNEKSEIEEQ